MYAKFRLGSKTRTTGSSEDQAELELALRDSSLACGGIAREGRHVASYLRIKAVVLMSG
jgi:hypothetical protein